MFFGIPLKEKINNTEKRLREIAISRESRERAFAELLKKWDVTQEEINQTDYGLDDCLEEEREEMARERREFFDQIRAELAKLSDPKAAEKTRQEMALVQSSWLQVR